MSYSANVQSVQALEEMKSALAGVRAEAQSSMDAAAIEIRRTQDWIQERVQHWQNEMKRCQAAVRQAAAALHRCESARYRDKDGNVTEPDCSRFEAALAEAERRLAAAESELATAQRARQEIKQAVGAYERESRRLAASLNNDVLKASAMLDRTVGSLLAYLAVSPSAGETAAGHVSPPAAVQPHSIPWAEREAIFKRMDEGQPVTKAELEKLSWPISDLQAQTIASDDSWLQQILESERYREAVRPGEAVTDWQDLVQGLLVVWRAHRFWDSKTEDH